MPKPFQDIRALLIQARNTEAIELQEQLCFLERCRLQAPQLVPVNVVRTPLLPSLLDEVDVLFIGGAGEYSAADDHPWMARLLHLIQEAGRRRLPTFGSCWGHQLIARAFGGRVIHDPERAEIGCGYVELTPAAQQDRLFCDFPQRFKVNMGHHDRVDRLPPDAVEMASNDSQPNQAFRVGDLPMYGTQFHSELSAERERERLLAYRAYYRELDADAAFQAAMESLADTSEVDHLLNDFLVKFVAHGDEE